MSLILKNSVHFSGSSVTSLTATLASGVANGDLLIASLQIDAVTGVTIVPPAGWTLLGSVVQLGTNITLARYSRIASGDGGANYTWSWGAFASAAVEVHEWNSTQGTTPAVDGVPATTTAASTANITVPNPTLGQASEIIDFAIANEGGVSAFPAGPINILLLATPTLAVGYYGSSSTIAPSAPTFTSTSTANWAVSAIAIKETVAGAAIPVSVGAQASGSGLSLTTAVPPQAQVGDMLIAQIAEVGVGSAGVGIIPPPDIAFRGANQQGTSGSSFAFVPSATVQAGDLMVMMLAPWGQVSNYTITGAPAGWTQQVNSNNVGGQQQATIYTKIAASGESGNTYTWTTLSTHINWIFDAAYSLSGGTMAVGASSTGDTGSSTSTNNVIAALTTGGANRIVVIFDATGGTPSLTFPAGTTKIGSNTTAPEAAWFLQPVAGSTGTKTVTANSAQKQAGCMLEISSGGTGSAWTLVRSDVDASNTTEQAIYTHVVAAGDPSSWTWNFASSVTAYGAIYAVGNLNATTPVDVSQGLSSLGASALFAPSISPTTGDELLFYLWASQDALGSATAVGSAVPLVSPLSQNVTAGYAGLDFCGPQKVLNNDNFVGAIAGATLGLKAATAPTRTSANARVAQFGLMVMSDTPPSPPPGGVPGPYVTIIT